MPGTLSNISADQALQLLVAGNQRFIQGQIRFPSQIQEMLKGLLNAQKPYATILGCSDSRVPPELVFDCGLGELFVIRVAGNVFSTEVAGSLQYAGAHLHTPLFVVLGHKGCGSVSAALKSRDEGHLHRSRIQLLVDNILPGLPALDPRLSFEERMSQAVESNVRWTMRQIAETPEGRARIADGEMKIVGALYQIAIGRVRFLE